MKKSLRPLGLFLYLALCYAAAYALLYISFDTHKIAITGDDYINIHNCTAPQAEFNRLAPYLARSVNQDSAKYRLILRSLKDMMDGEGWLILPGHGAILQRDQRM